MSSILDIAELTNEVEKKSSHNFNPEQWMQLFGMLLLNEGAREEAKERRAYQDIEVKQRDLMVQMEQQRLEQLKEEAKRQQKAQINQVFYRSRLAHQFRGHRNEACIECGLVCEDEIHLKSEAPVI